MKNMKRRECIISCLRKHRWKLVYFVDTKKLPPILFDMINDPNETSNVAIEHQDIVLEMISEILDWKISHNGRAKEPLSSMKIISDGVVARLTERSRL